MGNQSFYYTGEKPEDNPPQQGVFGFQHFILVAVAADAIMFKDDWGSETSLLISPRQWRQMFKPLYADYSRIIHEAGKFVFFHSDGYIADIYPDLIEVGVDAINSQLFCMDIEGLGAKTVDALITAGQLTDPADIYDLTAEEIASLERQGEKSAENLVLQIEGSKQKELWRLIAALNIPMVGTRTAEILAEPSSVCERDGPS